MSEQITKNTPTRPPATKRPRQQGKSKADPLRRLLSRQKGATVAQIQKHLGWQPHTIRAAISRLSSSGLPIDLDRSGKVARYRAVPGEER